MNDGEQAVEWFTRLRERELSAGERRRFVTWLMASPTNVRLYLDSASTWGALQSREPWPRKSTEEFIEIVRRSQVGNVRALTASDAELRSRPVRGRLWKIVPFALAAGIVGVAIGVWLHLSASARSYETVRGEQRYLVLPDGSAVQLNTLTKIAIHFDERRRLVELPSGEAFFRVAHDATRPFEVETPYARVRAIGTEFNVYNRPDGTRVAVLEGKVRVLSTVPASPAASTSIELSPRQAADVDRRGWVAAAKPKPETAWRERRISLDGERVDAAIVEFNRYNPTPLRVEDPDLASLRITGVFNADEPQAFVKYLQQTRRIAVIETRQGLLLRP